MNFLQKFGKGLLVATRAIVGLAGSPAGQLIERTFLPAPAIGPFEAVIHTVSSVERSVEALNTASAGGVKLSGEQKAILALPGVTEGILSAEFFYDKKIVDRARFEAGVRKVNDGVVDILSAVDHHRPEEVQLPTGFSAKATG